MAIGTEPNNCNEVDLRTAVSVTLASGSMMTTDNKQQLAYVLFESSIVIVFRNTIDNLKYAQFAVDLHGHDSARNFASWPAGIFVTSGPQEGAGVYELGLHGCLCAAGFYCSASSGGQCIATPPGKILFPKTICCILSFW